MNNFKINQIGIERYANLYIQPCQSKYELEFQCGEIKTFDMVFHFSCHALQILIKSAGF